MEEKYEIVDDEIEDIEVEKMDNNGEMIYIENQNEIDLESSSKVTESKKSEKLKQDLTKKFTSKPTSKKEKSGSTSLVNKSIGITSLNSSGKKSITPNTSFKSPNSISYGERLYRKAMALKDIKEKRNLEVKSTKEKETKNHCPFNPKLNDDSCLMSMKKFYDRPSADSSFASAVLPKKKVIESYIKKKEEEELKELK